ncbi:Oidioi.mRNA.OKI2018_I69.chr2.g4873.t1.cds [Oikopleura dioica]|uniref:Oidioi.mRNA.OKI2018_I69.chr2.g4873.t1.cds n=1 Tax=Oikopleura dioica TaxID=34765 RepID=A0ABN7SYA1_OIKDI|nr:Oidioi.mRNA.OKI2018_I69.chr2.g4873.t1.cds [Oikopleura dioica]
MNSLVLDETAWTVPMKMAFMGQKICLKELLKSAQGERSSFDFNGESILHRCLREYAANVVGQGMIFGRKLGPYLLAKMIDIFQEFGYKLKQDEMPSVLSMIHQFWESDERLHLLKCVLSDMKTEMKVASGGDGWPIKSLMDRKLESYQTLGYLYETPMQDQIMRFLMECDQNGSNVAYVLKIAIKTGDIDTFRVYTQSKNALDWLSYGETADLFYDVILNFKK